LLPNPTAPVKRTVETLAALTRADLRIRYGRGPLRRLKWLMDPIAALGIYLALIVFVIDRAGTAPGLSVACAVVPFQLVIMTVANSLRAVEVRRQIVGNMAFSRILIPVSATLTETIGFAACLILLPVMMAAYTIAPTPALLLLPVVIALTFVLAVAFAYPATLVGVWMQEISTFIISGTRTLFFVAPGLVALDEVSGKTHDLLKLNPLSGIFESYRAIFIDGRAPAAWMLLVPLAYAVVLLAIFVPMFAREQRHLAKLLM
jgi:lipopolysaccharide transport system permease protein